MTPSTMSDAQVEQLDFSEPVTVVVGDGDSKQQFFLHKNIISRHSKFFRAALAGNFVEAKDKSIKLPEADPAIFKIWLQWAYSGNMVMVLLSASEQEVETEDYTLSKQRCGELYVLSDVLDDALCRNVIIDLLKDKFFMTKGPTTGLLDTAYKSTPENSKLRLLCLDWMLANVSANDTWLVENRDDLPTAFFADVTIELAKAGLDKSRFRQPRFTAKCKYHDHDEDVPSCEGEPKKTPVENKKD